jgi:chemotaxis protein MotA
MAVLDQILRFMDPFALIIVFGGTLLVTVFRSTAADLGRAFEAIRLLWTADPDADARSARVSVSKISELAEARSIMCADRVETAQRFLLRAARQLSDSRSAGEFARWASDEIDARRARHQGVIGVWRAAAETAPAMGMIGTIIGLVQMFAAMDDPARLGPGMAVAMLTTLYGVFVSSAIAGPVAGRLERLSETELAWQIATCRQFELLARAEFEPAPVKARPALRTVP